MKAISLAEQIATKNEESDGGLNGKKKQKTDGGTYAGTIFYMYMWLCISVFLWRITKAGLLSRKSKVGTE